MLLYTELTLSSTGITGYLGGDVLSILTQDHPDWEISALVRSEEKAKQLTSVYPNVRTVLGDVESTELIADEVKKADIVYSMSPQYPVFMFCFYVNVNEIQTSSTATASQPCKPSPKAPHHTPPRTPST